MKKTLVLLVLIAIVANQCEITEVYKQYYDYEDYYNGDSAILDLKSSPVYYACTVTALAAWLQFYKDREGLEYGEIVNEHHIQYYAYPKDGPSALLSDSSVSNNPVQDCLADFLKTSWYSEGCYYKATDHFNTFIGLNDFLEFSKSGYYIDCSAFLTFNQYVIAIDAGRPVYIVTKSKDCGHSRLGIGYVKSKKTYLSLSNGKIEEHPWNILGGKIRIIATADIVLIPK